MIAKIINYREKLKNVIKFSLTFLAFSMEEKSWSGGYFFSQLKNNGIYLLVKKIQDEEHAYNIFILRSNHV